MGQFILGGDEGVEFEVIPADTILAATIEECEVKESPFDIDDKDPSKGKKKQVSFKFRVSEGEEFANRVLFGNTPTTFTKHPDCKLRVWIQEILAQDSLADNFAFDTDDLVGMRVKVIVGNRPKKNADGTTGVRDFASDVIRIREVEPF